MPPLPPEQSEPEPASLPWTEARRLFLFPVLLSEKLGEKLTATIDQFGRFVRFAAKGFAGTVWGPGRFGRGRLLIPQLYEVGTQSIMVILVLGVFVGAAIGLEAYNQFSAFGLKTHSGALVAITVVAQIGPVLAATMFAGRVGGRISSEIATMQITEQIDAIRVMGVDPITHLVVPRVLACLIMMPVLTVFSDLVGVAGGYIVIVWVYHVDAVAYMHAMAHAVMPWDVFTGLFKSFVFGGLVGTISCYKGVHCQKGSQGVGKAVTNSFFTVFIWIILIDLLLVDFFRTLYPLLHTYAHPTVFG